MTACTNSKYGKETRQIKQKKMEFKERQKCFHTDSAKADCTTQKDFECWIKVLTLRLSLRP